MNGPVVAKGLKLRFRGYRFRLWTRGVEWGNELGGKYRLFPWSGWHLKREITAMERLPFGYGIAYRLYALDSAVCYPVPLNIVVHLWRAFWDALKYMPEAWFDQHPRRTEQSPTPTLAEDKK